MKRLLTILLASVFAVLMATSVFAAVPEIEGEPYTIGETTYTDWKYNILTVNVYKDGELVASNLRGIRFAGVNLYDVSEFSANTRVAAVTPPEGTDMANIRDIYGTLFPDGVTFSPDVWGSLGDNHYINLYLETIQSDSNSDDNSTEETTDSDNQDAADGTTAEASDSDNGNNDSQSSEAATESEDESNSADAAGDTANTDTNQNNDANDNRASDENTIAESINNDSDAKNAGADDKTAKPANTESNTKDAVRSAESVAPKTGESGNIGIICGGAILLAALGVCVSRIRFKHNN